MFFSENLKFLRKRKRISQGEVASSLGITRSTLAGYEKSVQPPYKTLIKLAEYFNVSVDALLRYDLKQLSEFHLSQIEKGFDVDVTGQKLRLLTISTNDDGDENIELVPVKAQAGYVTSFGDLDFIAKLPRFNLPFLRKEKTYRCFQIDGDSMLPIKNGAWVTASYIQDWTDVKDGTACIVVTHEEGIVFKLIYKKDDRTFLMVSLNRAYSPYEMKISSISEMWCFETYNGFDLE